MGRRGLTIVVGVVAAVATSFSVAKAQSLQSIEDQLKFYLDRINKYPSVSKNGGEDSLEYYNIVLTEYLSDILARQPLTMEYGFNKTGWRMNIATSKDKKFRIYSWDKGSGGTMHFYSSVLQYKVDERVRTLVYHTDTIMNGEWAGPGYYYTKIYEVTGRDTRTYYLAERHGVYSNTSHTVGIQCFTIENGLINYNVELFETDRGFQSSIDVAIDLVNVAKTKKTEIQFSSDNRKMYLPHLPDGNVSKRYLIYEFDGEKFLYYKVGKN